MGVALALTALAGRTDAKTLRIPVTSFDVEHASDRTSCEYVAL